MKYRGCIVEIRRNSMMVMTSDCLFLEVKKREGVFAGVEIQFDSQDIYEKKNKKLMQYISVAAVLVLLAATQLFDIKSLNISVQPAAVLTIDINPSIQLEIDEAERVISAEALNSDAKEFPLSGLINQPAKDAFQQIMEFAEAKGYITDEGENYVVVASVPLLKDEAGAQRLEVLVQELKESIEANAAKKNQVVVLTLKSDQETLNKAREEKLSVGRLEIARQLKASTDVSAEEISLLNVKELVREARERELPIPGWKARSPREKAIDKDAEDDKGDDSDSDRDDSDSDRDDSDSDNDNDNNKSSVKNSGEVKEKITEQGKTRREKENEDKQVNQARENKEDEDKAVKRSKEEVRGQEKEQVREKERENRLEDNARGSREDRKDEYRERNRDEYRERNKDGDKDWDKDGEKDRENGDDGDDGDDRPSENE